MPMRTHFSIGVMCVLAFASVAQAQVLTARISNGNWNYVYGGGADTHTGSQDGLRNNLLLTDSAHTGFIGSTLGTLPGGTPYGAGVNCDVDYQYTVQGNLKEIDSIRASGSTGIGSVVSGAGTAGISSLNPGNEIQLEFSVAHEIAYHLYGTIDIPAPSAFSAVAFQRFNGFNWEYLFWSAFLPNGEGDFDQSGTLAPGQYRVISSLALSASGTSNYSATYSYALDVPGLGGCGADLNSDGVVDDADFVVFVFAYNLLDCADPAMPAGCQSDLNRDGVVDDSDFTLFVVAYNALLCE